MFQDPPETPVAEIVVTAARLPPAAGDAAFSVIRLNPETLGRAQRLDEALASVPAVSLFRRTSSLSANPTTQGISLRAIAPSGAGRTLVTLDGVPLNDPFGGWVIWSQAPPEALDGVDIVRGAGAGPYGAGALAGVIALREGDGGGALDAALAERGGARIAGSVSGDLGGFRLVVSGLHEVSDGYVPVRGPAAGAADTPLDFTADSAALRADASLGAARLSLRVSAFEEERGSGLLGARATASGNSQSATLARTPDDRPGWRVQLWRRESDLANSSVAVAADRASTTPANTQFATPATGGGANAALRGSGDRIEWELGADARFTEGETRELFRYMGGAFTRDRVAGGRTAVAGLYAEASWRTHDWLVAGGLRADHWSNSDGGRLERDLATGVATLNEASPDRDGEVVSARLGVRRDLGDGWAARAAAYSGFRPATLNELHRPFRVGNDITEANAALEPERLQGVETGLSLDRDRYRLGATVFWNRIDDAIVNVTIAAGPGVFPRAGFVPAGGVLRERRNAGTIEATGIELDAEARLDHVRLTVAVSATDARLNGGLRPAQAPIWSAVAGIDWTATDRLGLSLNARYESRRFDDDLNSRVLDAALTLDARADWRLTAHTNLSLSLDNLTDEAVEVSETAGGVAGYGLPRTVSLGLRYAW